MEPYKQVLKIPSHTAIHSREEADPARRLRGVSERTIICDYGSIRSWKINTLERADRLFVSPYFHPPTVHHPLWDLSPTHIATPKRVLSYHQLIVCLSRTFVATQEEGRGGHDPDRQSCGSDGEQEGVQLHPAGRQSIPLVHRPRVHDAGGPTQNRQQISHVSTVHGKWAILTECS